MWLGLGLGEAAGTAAGEAILPLEVPGRSNTVLIGSKMAAPCAMVADSLNALEVVPYLAKGARRVYARTGLSRTKPSSQ